MNVDVTTDIVINRPIDEVAKYAADPDNATKWYKNITSVEWRTAKPLVTGSRIAFKAKFLRRNLEYVYEIVELTPKKLLMRTSYRPFLMETTYLWNQLDNQRTQMILKNKGNPKGFSRFFIPIMTLAMLKANNDDLKQLKKVLESDNA